MGTRNHSILQADEWEFVILKGNLSFDGTTYANPFDYIQAFDENYQHTSYTNQMLDYQAIHIPTQVALVQLWGKLYEDQQDMFAIGELPTFAFIREDEKKDVLNNTFCEMQRMINEIAPEKAMHAGSTACAVIITANKIYTAHLGDSVAYLCLLDAANQLTYFLRLNKNLHKAGDEGEISRVEEFLHEHDYNETEVKKITSRMRYQFDPRLGPFAITAALGDTAYDHIGMLHLPEVDKMIFDIPPQGKAIVIVASDGLTEQLDEDELKNLIEEMNAPSADRVALTLAQAAFDAGSTDNITVLVKEIQSKENKTMYMAVFDGHGGNEIARISSQIFKPILEKEIINQKEKL